MNSYPPRLLITGASGFTGRHACSYFSEIGFEITGVTRKKSIIQNGIHSEYCDLTNKEEVKELIKKNAPQFLLHLAGQNHVGNSWMDPVNSLETNAMSTAYLIDAIRLYDSDCKIVIVGSALQYNPAKISTLIHPYSLSKSLQILIAQSWAALYSMDIVIAKPSNLIGPGSSNGVCSLFAQKIIQMEQNKTEKILEVNNLQAERDFLDVRDAVRAYETLLRKGKSGEIYDISSGKSRSLKEVIEVMKSIAEVDFEVKTTLNSEFEQRVEITADKIMELGWKPSIPFESSLKDILHFYRHNKIL